MSRQHHYIKAETENFQAVERGEKLFEVRKNDRDYKKYDMVHLQECVDGNITGRQLDPLEIKHIFYGGQYGLAEDHCIFNW